MKKYLALLLVLVTVISLFAGCGSSDEIKLPKVDIEDTLENRQKAAVEVGKAYYYKDPYMQYDNRAITDANSSSMGWRAQFDMDSTPEYASEDLTLYSVCSSFVYDTIYQSVGFSLLDNRAHCLTDPMSAGRGVPEEILLFTHVNEGNDEATNLAAMETLKSMLQPGDAVTYYRPQGSGHTVLYCNDLTGDGKNDILHCDGHGFDFTNGVDETEPNGSIKLNNSGADSAEGFLFTESFHQYLLNASRYSLIRASLLDPKEYPLTEAAKSRLLYPDMAIFHTTDCGNYGAVNVDGELTYTLTIKNNGTQDYKGILVQIPAPKNAEIVSFNGEKRSAKTLKFNLDVPAGQEAVITYAVKPTGGVGSVIESVGGYVHTINLPRILTAVQKTGFDGETVRAAMKEHAGKEGAEFVNSVWKTLTPDAPAVPEFDDLRSAMFDRKSVGDLKLYQMKEATEEATLLTRMMVPEYFGGRKVITPTHNRRVLTLRYQDLQPGDVVIFATSSMLDISYGIFDGEMLVVAKDGKNKALLDVQFENLLAYDFFIALRPTQAM